MLTRGSAPFLECSSRGEKRLSAFYARPRSLNGRSIEDAYQGMKKFEDGSTNLHWRAAKGRRAINSAECAAAYTRWWQEYISEHPDLLALIRSAPGHVHGRDGRLVHERGSGLRGRRS